MPQLNPQNILKRHSLPTPGDALQNGPAVRIVTSKQSNASNNILEHFKRPGIFSMFQLRKTGVPRFTGSQKEQLHDYPVLFKARNVFRGTIPPPQEQKSETKHARKGGTSSNSCFHSLPAWTLLPLVPPPCPCILKQDQNKELCC